MADWPAAGGQTTDPKYFWSNFPTDTPLAVMVEYAHRRAWAEQFHEEAKELLGWDQYQGRLWPGFHRNAALVMLSYSFLVWLEWRQRQSQIRRGPRRRAFSPRRDRRRTSLPEIHRRLADRLRELALSELLSFQDLT